MCCVTAGCSTLRDRLRAGIGLVSMGDHFDYGAKRDFDRADRRRAGLEGCALLEWLTTHPPEQCRVLVGNHDLARVQDLARVDEATFAEAQAWAAERGARGKEAWLAAVAEFNERYPEIPTPGVAVRDFSTFVDEQPALLQRLLAEGRLDCALAGEVAGRPCLLTHTGVTTRELAMLDIPRERHPERIAAALARWFDDRVASAASLWGRGQRATLDLTPVHVAGSSPNESGGWFSSRPANPDRPGVESAAWETAPGKPRRFHPNTLPAGLWQVVGHTRHEKLAQEMVPWVADEFAVGDEYRVRSLRIVGEDVRYGPGLPLATDGAIVLFTDAGLHRCAGGGGGAARAGRRVCWRGVSGAARFGSTSATRPVEPVKRNHPPSPRAGCRSRAGTRRRSSSP